MILPIAEEDYLLGAVNHTTRARVRFFFFRIIGNLPNTYAFTKSLAEDAIRREAQGLPILVFRPTVGTFSIFI